MSVLAALGIAALYVILIAAILPVTRKLMFSPSTDDPHRHSYNMATAAMAAACFWPVTIAMGVCVALLRLLYPYRPPGGNDA